MKVLFSSLILSAAMMGSAWADQSTGQDNREAARDFKALDTDKSGALSKKEAAGIDNLSRNFNEYDKNGDGSLEFGEFAHFSGSVDTSVRGMQTPLEKKGTGATDSPGDVEQHD